MGEDFLRRLIITRDKTLVKGAVLIDDKPHVTGAVTAPDWTHLLFDQPYNRDNSLSSKPRLSQWCDWRTSFTTLGLM